MTFDEIRAKLASTEGRKYWRSLEELADTPEFRGYVDREFPAQASEFTDPAGRREFLKLMGASLALAGVSACTRQPDEAIIPYVRQPEEIIPGRPLFYATAMPFGGIAMPLLAENHMGRPTKLEGNPEHPASLGATDIFAQASVLSLYDPDRSRSVVHRGEMKGWSAAVAALQAIGNTQRAIKGQTLRLLTEPISSPSIIEQIETLLAACPEAKWHQWDPVFGAVQGGAPATAATYHFDKADVVVALDADFLGCGAGSVRYTKDFSSRRHIGTPQDSLNRLYVVEPTPTVTGTKADHRLPLKARDVEGFAGALGAAVGVSAGAGAAGEHTSWIAAAAGDLKSHRGRSVVVAGDRQPAAVHAIARAINDALGNTGTTVVYGAPVTASPVDGCASIAELVRDMNAGKVDVLIMIDGNPAFTAPADLSFTQALDKVATRVHFGLYQDETAEHCHWHIPAAHYLESWGDARAFDGTVSIIQPLIAPIYDGRQAIEVFAALNGVIGQAPVDLVKDYWKRAFDGKTRSTWTLRDRDGKAFDTSDRFWRHALHDGFVTGGGMQVAGSGMQVSGGTQPATRNPQPENGVEVVFRPDPTILDGRFANNGWLQELPKPLCKVTWDNVAYVSPRTAERNNIGKGDLIEVKLQGRSARIPVWIQPGTADDVVVVHFGYGRRKVGRVGNGVGHDTFGIRPSTSPWFASGAEIVKTGDKYDLAATQNHFAMEERNPVRVVDIEEYERDPKKSVAKLGVTPPAKTLTLYPVREYTGYKWGMSIDLNSCTGCSACMIACVAENNIAVTGKTQVMRTREMHWIRVDTYFEGGIDAPEVHNQPVPCMQCENAPCEVVCPVAATSHNDEGLNDMVYNRCVGTRYCSNNCPYKVRRFNFLLYSDFETRELDAVRNPDVTIRSRGVMEKCTYCVQRISHARIDAKTEGRKIKDGEIKTACQQVCPADAIVFGDLNDPASTLVERVKQDRNYGLLEDLGTRPRTTYLAVVKNPNPALEKKTRG